MGENEAEGLRCIYHGWKFDVSGSCVDMPCESSENTFRAKVKARTYPCAERGGVVWTYMGPRRTPPRLPDLEANMPHAGRGLDDHEALQLSAGTRGDKDSVHFGILHMGHLTLDDTHDGNFIHYQLRERAPCYEVKDIACGISYGA